MKSASNGGVLKGRLQVLQDVYKRQGLDGVNLIVGDKCLGMLEAVGEVFPEAKYQRCTVHFYLSLIHI